MPTDTETPNTCKMLVDLLPGTALDVLLAEERLEVQAHVATCSRCAAELAELEEAAAVLAAGVPQVEPPADLKGRVLAAAREERADAHPPQRARPRLLPAWRRVTPMWGAVAAAVVVSVGSLTWAASLQSQVATLSAQAQVAQAERQKAASYDAVVSVLASNQLAVRSLTPVSTGVPATGTVWLDPSSGSGMIMVRGLPQLLPGRAWQLWFVRGSTRESGGMLWTDKSGTGYTLIKVPRDLDNYESLGITEEPATGSPWPTTPRVAGTQL